MEANEAHIHTFSGEYFDVVVWRATELNKFTALIRTKAGSIATIYKSVIECSALELHELEKLSNLAATLIEHLEAGVSFAHWNFHPSRN
jgi:hypothetical protein